MSHGAAHWWYWANAGECTLVRIGAVHAMAAPAPTRLSILRREISFSSDLSDDVSGSINLSFWVGVRAVLEARTPVPSPLTRRDLSSRSGPPAPNALHL